MSGSDNRPHALDLEVSTLGETVPLKTGLHANPTWADSFHRVSSSLRRAGL